MSKRKHRTKNYETQAHRIISRFGGPKQLQKALEAVGYYVCVSAIYKWRYSTQRKGCNGVIPAKHMNAIIKAARVEGIYIPLEDFFPGPLRRAYLDKNKKDLVE